MPILPLEISPEKSKRNSDIQSLACSYYAAGDHTDWIFCVSRARKEIASNPTESRANLSLSVAVSE